MLSGNGKYPPVTGQSLRESILPPNNQEAEEAVLGSLLNEPEASVWVVAPILTPESFYHQRNAAVYAAICALQIRHEPIDLLTVSQELKRRGPAGDADPESYLAKLTNAVPTAMNAEHYANLVAAAFVRRRMLSAASEIAKLAYAQGREIDDCVADAGRALMDVQQDRNTGTSTTARTAINKLFQRIEFLHDRPDKNALLGLSTGYMDWDKMTSGSQAGDFIIVAARPGMGKSSLLKDLAVNACKSGKRAAFFTMETNTEQLMQRIVAGETGIDLQRLRLGDLRDDEWSNLTRMSMQTADWCLTVDDGGSLSVPALRAKVNRIYQQQGLDLILVDYLGLMHGNAENRVQEVTQISAGLKQIAREFNVPLIAAAQLSRNVEQRADKKPQLSDLRDSGSLEQDADIVAFIYRDEYYNPETDQKNIANINIAKNRNGPTGSLNLFFDKRLTSFKNLHRERVEL